MPNVFAFVTESLFPCFAATSTFQGKSETLLLRLTWNLKGNQPVSPDRSRSKTVPVLP